MSLPPMSVVPGRSPCISLHTGGQYTYWQKRTLDGHLFVSLLENNIHGGSKKTFCGFFRANKRHHQYSLYGLYGCFQGRLAEPCPRWGFQTNKRKSRIRETEHLSTDADSSTDTQKPEFIEKQKKSSKTEKIKNI